MRNALQFRWAVGLALIAAGGCGGQSGPPRVAVTGAVSIDGAPLATGIIRFVPTGDTRGPAAVSKIEHGTYTFSELDGPIFGTHRVEIESVEPPGFAIDDEQAYAREAEQHGGPPLPQNAIPGIYNNQSTLIAPVRKDGPRHFDFAISTTGSDR